MPSLLNATLPRWVFAAASVGVVALLFRASAVPGDVLAPKIPGTVGNLLHFAVHAMLAFLLLRTFVPAPQGYGAPTAWPGFQASTRWVLPLIVLHGLLDEAHQFAVPGRSCSVYDVIVDGCGGAFVLLVPLPRASGRPRSVWPALSVAVLGLGLAWVGARAGRPPGDAALERCLEFFFGGSP